MAKVPPGSGSSRSPAVGPPRGVVSDGSRSAPGPSRGAQQEARGSSVTARTVVRARGAGTTASTTTRCRYVETQPGLGHDAVPQPRPLLLELHTLASLADAAPTSGRLHPSDSPPQRRAAPCVIAARYDAVFPKVDGLLCRPRSEP